MNTLEQIKQECKLTFDEIQQNYKELYEKVFQDQQHWLINIEDKTWMLKGNRTDIESVIQKIKDPDAQFTNKDLSALSKFIGGVDKIINVNNWINNFTEGKDLNDGTKLSLVKEFNKIKSTQKFADYALSSNTLLSNFVHHVFSIIKHCQQPEQYPVYYPFWRNILGNVLQQENDYDSLCNFYRTIEKPRSLSLGAYFGAIGILLAEKITANKLIQDKEDPTYNKIKKTLLNIEYFDLITGYRGLSLNNEARYSAWLEQTKIGKSNKQSSYVKAIKILSKILKKDLFETRDKMYLNNLYEDLLKEQTDENGRFFYQDAPSYGKSRFYSGSINSYINFLDLTNSIMTPDDHTPTGAVGVKNRLAQAICLVGESGVGKSYRVKKTLANDGHKTLFVIVDNMWQHILIDYSPEERAYKLTKVGKFIEDASKDLGNHYTIVFDECHKNLEIINDVLLQAISTKRNGGIRFLSLNSLVDGQFSFLTEDNGTRILPDNLGFVFVSSKTELIQSNDDLRKRIEIIELTELDREKENHTLDYLFDKIQEEDAGDFTN